MSSMTLAKIKQKALQLAVAPWANWRAEATEIADAIDAYIAGMGEPVAWLDMGKGEAQLVFKQNSESNRASKARAAELMRTVRTGQHPLYLSTAPPIDLAAVREVIADIRNSISDDGTTVLKDGEMRSWADKLESAIKGVA